MIERQKLSMLPGKKFLESNTFSRENRTVIVADAIAWLEEQKEHKTIKEGSFLASMPDISEFPSWTLEEWKVWFTNTAKLVMEVTPDEGVALFYQSDIKKDGIWIDKSFLIQKAAEEVGLNLLWHKVVCRLRPGYTSFGRPAYTHILAFSKNIRLLDHQKSTADVIPDLGDKTWERGMGLTTCLMLANFIKENTPSKTLYQLFCGEGAMLAMANEKGLNAVGVEKTLKRAKKAFNLEVYYDKEKKNFAFKREIYQKE